jgi:drug/metabolite transporter (DMT)-like permease
MPKENQNSRTSVLLVTLAALCWGISGGIGGVLMNGGWDAFVVSFYRGVIGLLFVLAWLVARPHGSGLGNCRLWFWAIVAGIGVTGNFSFYFMSIAEGSIAVAVTLMYCAPVFVYLISFGLKLEKPTLFKWGAIAVVIVGIILLTGIYDIGAGSVTAIGIGSGLLAGLSYAVFIFGFKNAAYHGSPQAILVIAFTTLAAILYWPSDSNQITQVLRSADWPLFTTLGLLGAGLSFVFYIVGLKETAPTVASVVAMIEPVTASLVSVPQRTSCKGSKL